MMKNFKSMNANDFENTTKNLEEEAFSEENDVIIPASGETSIDIATASCVQQSGIILGGDLNIIKSSINGVFLSFYLWSFLTFQNCRCSYCIIFYLLCFSLLNSRSH